MPCETLVCSLGGKGLDAMGFFLRSPGRSPSSYDNEIVMMNHVYKERFPKVRRGRGRPQGSGAAGALAHLSSARPLVAGVAVCRLLVETASGPSPRGHPRLASLPPPGHRADGREAARLRPRLRT